MSSGDQVATILGPSLAFKFAASSAQALFTGNPVSENGGGCPPALLHSISLASSLGARSLAFKPGAAGLVAASVSGSSGLIFLSFASFSGLVDSATYSFSGSRPTGAMNSELHLPCFAKGIDRPVGRKFTSTLPMSRVNPLVSIDRSSQKPRFYARQRITRHP